jgi:hypothetical protein
MASQTVRGQKLLEPIVSPIPYNNKYQINKETLKEFKIEQLKPVKTHKFNHVYQNIKLASLYDV